IIACYGLYSSISTAIEGTATEKAGTSAYLSLFTTVVFGIMGFFSRFWNKKAKTKTMDFLFSGYIMIAIMMNIMINFMTINKATVTDFFNQDIPFIGSFLVDISGMLTPESMLPIITLQNIITIVYALVMLFQKNSDFQANIRLGAASAAYSMVSDKNLLKLKSLEEKAAKKLARKQKQDQGESIKPAPSIKIKKPDYITLLKSIVLAPGFNKFGVDVNSETRAKARQLLSLIAEQSVKPEDVEKIVAFLRGHTILKKRTAKQAFLSPEAFSCLGEIGKKHPDSVLTPLLDGLSGADLLKKRYILNALGLMGSQTGKVKQILAKEDVKEALNDPSYEVKNAAILSIVEIGLELNDVQPVLDELYAILEAALKNQQPREEYLVETLLISISKLSVKQPRIVNISKIISVLDYRPAGADADTMDYILQNAIRILAFLAHYNPDKMPVQQLMAIVLDKREFIRYVAIDALGNLILVKNVPEIVQLLVTRSLEDDDADVRAMCNESIAEYCTNTKGEDESIIIDGKAVNLLEFYIAKLDASDSFIAENASEALKLLAHEFSASIYKRLEPKIAGNDEEIIRDCVNVLSTLNEDAQKEIDLALLYARLDDTSDETRAEILRLLGYIGLVRKDVDLQRVARFLNYGKNPEIRLNAIFALGKIGKLQPVNVTSFLLERLDNLDPTERNIEVEVLYESLGVIGHDYPFDDIITALERALMGDTNPFSKDVIAKALFNIGDGLIMASMAKDKKALAGSKKMTYRPGNIIMIFLTALQLKSLPDEVIDIISDGIQDLLPYFLITDKSKQKFEYLDTLKAFLVQAYNSNFSHEILETIDRINSLKAFRLFVDEEQSDLLKNSSKFYAKQYTPDGKQFFDQGRMFKALGFEKYALASFQISLELSPNEYFSPLCHVEIGDIYKNKDPAKARKELDTASNIFAFFDDITNLKKCKDKMSEAAKKI
nr:hypothetical protein [Candidatus Sigynarchaeota archaeon]